MADPTVADLAKRIAALEREVRALKDDSDDIDGKLADDIARGRRRSVNAIRRALDSGR